MRTLHALEHTHAHVRACVHTHTITHARAHVRMQSLPIAIIHATIHAECDCAELLKTINYLMPTNENTA